MQALNFLIPKHKALAVGGQEQVGDGDALDLLFAVFDELNRKVAGQKLRGKGSAVDFCKQVFVFGKRHLLAGDYGGHQNVSQSFCGCVFLKDCGGQALGV